MTGIQLRIIDAFTDRPYAGNQAAVVLLEAGWPDEVWMQQVAAEIGFSETAFAHPLSGTEAADADWALRWFTPVSEVDLCGHATLATAHAIAADARFADGEPRDSTVRFRTRSGMLPTHVAADGSITLDFPAAAVTAMGVPEGLAEALRLTPVEVYNTGKLADWLVVVQDEATVRACAPDSSAVAAVTKRHDVRGIIVTAAAAEPDGEFDFVSRFFAPVAGVPEDPVTGSAHTALAPYWTDRLGRTQLVGLQASARTGLIRTTVVRRITGDRVHLTGSAVTILDGTWLQGPSTVSR